MPLLGLRFLSCYYAKVVKIMISQAKSPMFFIRFLTSKLWLIQASLNGEYNP